EKNCGECQIKYFVTGGYGEVIASILEIGHEPDLTLEGMRSMALCGVTSV
ncbi:MAG: hypothetical protein HQK54_07780, partial [Oligoflexales bacterium]|nr:hypothetical protein [Oligoflexales bacterium]